MRQKKYTFEDIVHFLRRCELEMSIITTTPPATGQAAQRAELAGPLSPAADPGSKSNNKVEEYPVVYKDLFDLFEAMRGDEPELSREQIMRNFRIATVNVVYSEEADEEGPPAKDGLKKSDKSKAMDGRQEAKERGRREREASKLDAKVDAVMKEFVWQIKADKSRKAAIAIADIEKETMLLPSFKALLSKNFRFKKAAEKEAH